jgi:hypothetical protein
MIVTAKDLLELPSFKKLSVAAIQRRCNRWRKQMNKEPRAPLTLEEISRHLGVPISEM